MDEVKSRHQPLGYKATCNKLIWYFYNKQCLCVLLFRYLEKMEGTDPRVTYDIYRHSRVTQVSQVTLFDR